MNKKGILWNMFGSSKKRKGADMATGSILGTALGDVFGGFASAHELEQCKKEYEQTRQAKEEYDKLMAQQMQQRSTAGNVQTNVPVPGAHVSYGNSVPSGWSTTTTQMYPPVTVDSANHHKYLLILQAINLIISVGERAAKRIMSRYQIEFSELEFSSLCSDVKKILGGDDDEDLDKVINDVAKEVMR